MAGPGSRFKADIEDLKSSGKAAESVSRTVSQHVGAGHLREAGLALTASTSLANLNTMATDWESWAKSWCKTMTSYGESLEKAARDYQAHDDRYTTDFRTVQQGVDGSSNNKGKNGPDPMNYVAP